MKAWVQDLILGLILLAFSIISFVYAFIMQDTKASYFLARADTYILLWVGILALLFPAFNYPQRQKAFSGGGSNYSFQTGMCNAGYLVLYLLLMNYLGFMISSALFLFALLAFFTIEARGGTVKGKVLCKEIIIMAHNYCYYRFCCAVSFRLSAGSTASGGFLGLIT